MVVASCGLPPGAEGAATLHRSALASLCDGFSSGRAPAVVSWAAVAAACQLSSCSRWAVQHRLSNFGTQASLLRDMWNLPEPGIKPVSPALAGRFLPSAPPGTS